MDPFGPSVAQRSRGPLDSGPPGPTLAVTEFQFPQQRPRELWSSRPAARSPTVSPGQGAAPRPPLGGRACRLRLRGR
jgi:hypothetical protein